MKAFNGPRRPGYKDKTVQEPAYERFATHPLSCQFTQAAFPARQWAFDIQNSFQTNDDHHDQVRPAEPRIADSLPAHCQSQPDQQLSQDNVAHIGNVDAYDHVRKEAVSHCPLLWAKCGPLLLSLFIGCWNDWFIPWKWSRVREFRAVWHAFALNKRRSSFILNVKICSDALRIRRTSLAGHERFFP